MLANHWLARKKMRQLETDFESDWRNFMSDQLAEVGYTVPPTDSFETVSVKYWNIAHRTIKQRPRRFCEPTGFTVPSEHQRAYGVIKSKAQSGGDLRPHQSTRLTDELFNDRLYNDWGIHHFHLGNVFKDSSFLTRTDDLLMARVSESAFYAIMIDTHESWSDDQLVEILHQNWPELIADRKLSDSQHVEMVPTAAEREKLRKAGVSAPVMTRDGTVYGLLGGGYTISGRSMKVQQDLMYYHRRIRELERSMRSRIPEIVEAAWRDGVCLPDPLRLRLGLDNEFFVVRETLTGREVHREACRGR